MQTSLATLLLLGLATSLATAASTAKATDKTTDDTNKDDTTTKMDETKDENNTISIPTFKSLHCPPGFAQNSSCSTKFCVVTCGNGQYFLKDIKTELYHLLPPIRSEGFLEEGEEVEEEDKEEGDEEEVEGKDEGDEEDLEEENNKEEEEDKDEVMNTDE